MKHLLHGGAFFVQKIFLWGMLLLSLPLFAFSTGDIVTINSAGHYLSAGSQWNITLSDMTSPDDYSLWVVKTDDGVHYSFESYKQTGYFLNLVNVSWYGGATLTTTESWFTFTDQKLASVIDGTTCYLRYNSGWNYSTTNAAGATQLDINAYEKHTVSSFQSLSVTPLYSSFTYLANESKQFTVNATLSSMVCYVNGTDTVLKSVESVPYVFTPQANIQTSNFVISSVGVNTVNVVTTQAALANSNIDTLTVSCVYQGQEYNAISVLRQEGRWLDERSFKHKEGGNFHGMMDNGMQKVHEYLQVIYMADGMTRRLQSLQQISREYLRWYNYDTDNGLPRSTTNIPGGLTIAANLVYNNLGTAGVAGRGVYRTGYQYVSSLFFTQTTPAAPIRVACDQSTYRDGKYNTTPIVEPTLSQRIVFDIRPSSEMSDLLSTCTGNKFLEEYDIMAPTGKTLRVGPQYAYMDTISIAQDTRNNVYNFSNYYITPTHRITQQVVWKRNGVVIPTTCYKSVSNVGPKDNQVTNGRLLQLKAGNAGTIDTLTLTYTYGGTTYNIARFVIRNQNLEDVGPIIENTGTGEAIISDEHIAEDYILLSERNFDFALPNPNITTPQIYDTTLQLSESYYGYANMTGDIPRAVDATNPGMAEYFFVNKIAKFNNKDFVGDLNHRTGIDKGYFMYVDAADDPGVAMNLQFKGDFCTNAKLAFSAWVANLDPRSLKHLSPVNLNFVVLGIDEDGKEIPISTYTTGDVTLSQKWHQIFFDIPVDMSYSAYRLKIINNGFASAGNNLAIDDIKVLLKKPPVLTYQTSAECHSASDTINSVIRLTYSDLKENGWLDKSIYYQWEDDYGDSILTSIDYINKFSQTGNAYGVITIPTDTASLSPSDYYPYAETFLEDTENEKNIGYVLEQVNGKELLRIYIKHLMRTHVGNVYTAHLALESESLTDTVCGMSSSIEIRNVAQMALNGTVQSTNVIMGLCDDQVYETTLRVFEKDNLDDNSIALLEGECLCDWLEGNPKQASNVENIATYGATYENIESAIRTLRAWNPTINVVDTITVIDPTSMLTDTQVNLLKSLSASKKLTLGQQTYSIHITTEENTKFTIFPIESTGLSVKDGVTPVAVCPDEIEVDLGAQELNNDSLQIGIYNEIIPEIVDTLPRVFRVSTQEANTTISIPFKKARNVEITSIKITSANDPTFTTPVSYQLNKNRPSVTSMSDTIKISKLGSETFILKGGYEYHFTMEKTNAILDCEPRELPFTVKVIPDTVIWLPMANNYAWSNDSNWYTGNADGQVIRRGYVPQKQTHVIVKTNNSGVYPILSADTEVAPEQAIALEPDAQPYISYDIYFDKYKCNNIYFMPDAKIQNQHLLDYNLAWVDMVLLHQRWTMISSPLKGIYTGDLYVPSIGNDARPFQTGVEDGRGIYPIWQSMYNRMAYNMEDDGTTTNIVHTTWTQPTNALATQIQHGQGQACWASSPDELGLDTVIVKLPKTETSYYYYYIGTGVKTDISETIDRPHDYGKLAFSPIISGGDTIMPISLSNNTDGQYFLFGNPTMADINLDKFFEENDDVLTGTYYDLVPHEGSYTMSQRQYTPFIGRPDSLPPMHSILLETNSASKNLDLKVSAHMLYVAKTNKKGGLRTKRVTETLPDRNVLRMTALRNGVCSHAVVAENKMASDDLVLGEDARLLMLDKEKTPSALYTTAPTNNQALSINVLNKFTVVPLLYDILDESEAETFDITFDGVSSFDYDLQLFDAYTGAITTLYDGLTVTLEDRGNTMCYFIMASEKTATNLDNTNAEENEANIHIFNENNGMIVISADQTIQSVSIFNMVGQKIYYRDNIQTTLTRMHLPKGVYLLNVKTENAEAALRTIVQ